MRVPEDVSSEVPVGESEEVSSDVSVGESDPPFVFVPPSSSPPPHAGRRNPTTTAPAAASRRNDVPTRTTAPPLGRPPMMTRPASTDGCTRLADTIHVVTRLDHAGCTFGHGEGPTVGLRGCFPMDRQDRRDPRLATRPAACSNATEARTVQPALPRARSSPGASRPTGLIGGSDRPTLRKVVRSPRRLRRRGARLPRSAGTRGRDRERTLTVAESSRVWCSCAHGSAATAR
jgi:hypothetical protein